MNLLGVAGLSRLKVFQPKVEMILDKTVKSVKCKIKVPIFGKKKNFETKKRISDYSKNSVVCIMCLVSWLTFQVLEKKKKKNSVEKTILECV
jgi:hypothetical protein